MTKNEAIDTLKLMQAQVEWDYPMDYSVAIDMAIAALAKEPITCEDCQHYKQHDKRCNYWNHGVTPSEWCCHAEKEMAMEKLKPCPFCGMPYTGLYWVTTEQRSGFDTLGIFCNNCKQTVTLEENDWEGDTPDTKRKAIKAWNRRTGEQDE